MVVAALHRRLGPERAVPAGLAISAVCGCALLALVDPDGSDRYPTCPTRALLGIDCPACGTLRGLHALGRGRLGEALDHNVLLALAVPLAFALWWRWVRASLGRPSPAIAPPAWAVPAAVVLAATFAVLRNLPVPSLAWLGSGA